MLYDFVYALSSMAYANFTQPLCIAIVINKDTRTPVEAVDNNSNTEVEAVEEAVVAVVLHNMQEA